MWVWKWRPKYSACGMARLPLQSFLLTMLPIFGMSRNRSRVWNFWFSSWNSSMCLFLVCMTFCNGKEWWGGGNWSSIKLITIMLYQETHCLLPHWLKKKTFFTERLVKLLNALNRRKLADSLAKCYNKVMINGSIDFMNQKKDCSSTF